MKVLVEGHAYELEGDGQGAPQPVQFILKAPVAGGPAMSTIAHGTTNEEVIGMLIDRLNHLQRLMPCKENEAAIQHLVEAYNLLYQRTKERQERGVEGLHVP